MEGRGEFSFLIADQAARAADGGAALLNKTQYSGVIWALLLSSISSPFFFKYYLRKGAASEKTNRTVESGKPGESADEDNGETSASAALAMADQLLLRARTDTQKSQTLETGDNALAMELLQQKSAPAVASPAARESSAQSSSPAPDVEGVKLLIESG
jgi:hypothetical protein